jgi:ribosomal protein S18 acetylase RimI-like enzyme
MKKGISIRRAKIKDLDDILRLNFDLFKNEYDNYDDTLNLKWTNSHGKEFFKSKIGKISGFAEVAEVNGKVVGYLCGEIYQRMFYRKKAKYARLANVLVEDGFRGSGIGTKLTKNFMDWCKEKKVDYVSVTASAHNGQGIGFYRNLGFKDYDLTLEINLKSGKDGK